MIVELDLGLLDGVFKGRYRSLFFLFLIEKMAFEQGTPTILKGNHHEIAKRSGYSVNTVRQEMDFLTENGFLEPGRGSLKLLRNSKVVDSAR